MSSAQLFYPLSSTQAQAAMQSTRLTGGKVRLWKSGFTPTFSTTIAELNAVEADYDGYPAGGVTLPSFTAPIMSPGQGSYITGPVVQFQFAGGGSNNTNLIGGFYLVAADGTLWVICQFPDPIPMQEPSHGFPVTVAVGCGSN